MNPKLGIYKHYKGNDYQVLGVVRHSETDEILVLYRPLYGNRALWVRPLESFMEQIEIEGNHQPRFKFLFPTIDPDN